MNAGASENEKHFTQANDLRFSPRPNRANEIAWQPWDEEAFERAASEGKPVLLSISAVWCHWCHVMDETSYSDREVIELINRKYIPVRVDSDRNPDINGRYNQGGWPTTVFLNHEGTALAGATYLPPETMRKVLKRISELYQEHGDDIPPAALEKRFGGTREGEPDLETVRRIGEDILDAWDRSYGGLGSAPKFPQADTIDLALELYVDEERDEYLVYALDTLRAMISGGLFDKLEGGFFRYSTTRDWSIPHYEKMLSDNAALLSSLLKAYSHSGDTLFRNTALKTAAYIARTLSDGEAKLYGSQDADEEYYLLEAEERDRLASPTVDYTVYTDLASRAAISLLEAGAALGHREYTSQALAALEFLWSECLREGDGLAHYHDGAPHRWGLLDDQAAAAAAFATAYGFSGDRSYLERARILLELILERFTDDAGDILLDTARGHSLAALEPEPAGPGSQAHAIEAMLLYGALSGEEEWWATAGRLLSGGWTGKAISLGFMAAPLARAMNLYLRGPLLVKILGGGSEDVQSFLVASLLSPKPRTMPLRVELGTIDHEIEAEVCTMQACQFHSRDLEALVEYLAVNKRVLKEVEDHAPDIS